MLSVGLLVLLVLFVGLLVVVFVGLLAVVLFVGLLVVVLFVGFSVVVLFDTVLLFVVGFGVVCLLSVTEPSTIFSGDSTFASANASVTAENLASSAFNTLNLYSTVFVESPVAQESRTTPFVSALK